MKTEHFSAKNLIPGDVVAIHGRANVGAAYVRIVIAQFLTLTTRPRAILKLIETDVVVDSNVRSGKGIMCRVWES